MQIRVNEKKAFAIVLSLFLCLAIILCKQYAFAEAEGLNQEEPMQRQARDGVIDSLVALLEDGSGPVEDVGQWQAFRINAHFILPDGEIHAGDTTTISLPNELKFHTTASFPIYDQTGEHIVANAVIDGPGKTITLTYTDYPETHGEVSGNFYFYVRIDRNVVDEEMDIPLVFTIEGETVIAGQVHFIGYPVPSGYIIGKTGNQASINGNRNINYTININTQEETILNAVLRDQIMSPGITIDRDSLRIERGQWRATQGDWDWLNSEDVTSQCTVEWGEDGTSYTVYLGDINGEGYRVFYSAQSNYDFVDGERIRNVAEISGSNIGTIPSNKIVTYYEAGGSAEGYVYRINIVKEDEEGSPLAEAVFNVIRVSTNELVGTIITDGNGNGTLGGILKDTYEIVEVASPVGYELLSETITINRNDFNNDREAIIRVVNALMKLSIPVEKIWEGEEAESVTINLIADGIVIDTVTLTATDGWRHTFSDLPMYDIVDGHEIIYDVTEEDIEGYTVERTGDVSVGFTIKNINNTPPEEPIDPTPEEPTDPTPEEPTDPTPEEPTDPTPEEPTDPTPEEPTDPTPEEPTDPTPEEPMEPTPEEPTDPTPEKPTEPTPEKPIDPTPEKPTDPTPEKPTDPTPEKPTDPTPEKPTDPTPEKPTKPIPRVPTTTEKPTPPTSAKSEKPTPPASEKTASPAPKTGDRSNILPCIVTLLVAFILSLIIFLRTKSHDDSIENSKDR